MPTIAGSADAGTVIARVDGLEVGRVFSSTGSFSLVPSAPLQPGLRRFSSVLMIAGIESPSSNVVYARVLRPVDAGTDAGAQLDAGDDAGLGPVLDAGTNGGTRISVDGGDDAGSSPSPRFTATPNDVAL